VPATLDPGEGEPIELNVSVDGWRGPWMPTAGSLASIEFGGPRAAWLADGFYYSAGASAGVQSAGGGLTAGDVYRMTGVVSDPVALAELEAPGAQDGARAPDSLRTWVEEHASGTGGAALAELVSLLRDRGYLSHALSLGEDETEPWTESLVDYDFQPSASGHSLARIDALFSRLLEREADPRAAASDNYVAAIGDDEQFSVAVALMARELGFPSRVVLGARLMSPEPGLAVCEEGVCQAQDLTAWAEVQSSDGAWVPIDVTPQYAQSPSLEVTQQRDPEIVTEVRPDTVEEIVPPDPLQQDALASEQADEGAGLDLAWLWPILRATGIVLLVLALVVGPFAAVMVAKSLRRRRRRGIGTPSERIAGGWEEYVDAAIDAGRAVPRTATRTELAASLASAAGIELAGAADRAVFGGPGAGLAEAEAAEYWRVVDDERRALLRANGFWRGALATVSLRSIIRPLAPAPGARTLFAERGRRSSLRPARSTP